MGTWEQYMIERIRAVRSQAQKKADKYYNDYQNGGSSRTYNTYMYYNELILICDHAIADYTGENDARVRRHHNYVDFIDRIPIAEKYTRDELLELIRRTEDL